MARKRKVDLIQLESMLRSGLTMEQIGEHFGVGKGTVSKNAKALKFCKSQDIVFRSAERINAKKISAMARLERIAEIVEGELSYIRKTIKATSGEERRAWEDVQLKHCGEIRKQVDLLRDIAMTLYNVEEVEAFKKIVLEEIGAVDERVRDEILRRIKERRVDRGLAAIGQLGI